MKVLINRLVFVVLLLTGTVHYGSANKIFEQYLKEAQSYVTDNGTQIDDKFYDKRETCGKHLIAFEFIYE